MPRYVMVSVSSGVAWPTDEQDIQFGGRSIRLVPPTRDDSGELRAYPLAAIEHTQGDRDEELVRIIRGFLSALAWREQAAIREVDVTYGAPLRRGTRIPDNFTTGLFDEANLPDPSDPQARMALAFYREGMALRETHIAYSFLSFFKVLNIRIGPGVQQIAWINAHLSSAMLQPLQARVGEIRQLSANVGEYLYASGRCAVAHAFASPLVDPNAIADQQRLSRDLPLIQRLSALFICDQWGIAAPRF